MTKIKFENGITVNFDGEPTQADIDEIASQFTPSAPKTEDTGIIDKVGNLAKDVISGDKVTNFLDKASAPVVKTIDRTVSDMAKGVSEIRKDPSGSVKDIGKLLLGGAETFGKGLYDFAKLTIPKVLTTTATAMLQNNKIGFGIGLPSTPNFTYEPDFVEKSRKKASEWTDDLTKVLAGQQKDRMVELGITRDLEKEFSGESTTLQNEIERLNGLSTEIGAMPTEFASQAELDIANKKIEQYNQDVENYQKNATDFNIRYEYAKKNSDAPITDITNFAYKLSSGVSSMALSVGITVITKNPLIGAVALGWLEGSDTYNNSREKLREEHPDWSEDNINKISLRNATVDSVGIAILEKVGLDFLFRSYEGGVLRKMSINAITETVQETSQTIWSNIVARFGFDKTQKIFEGVGETLMVTLPIGFFGGAVTGGADLQGIDDIPVEVVEKIAKENSISVEEAKEVIKAIVPAIDKEVNNTQSKVQAYDKKEQVKEEIKSGKSTNQIKMELSSEVGTEEAIKLVDEISKEVVSGKQEVTKKIEPSAVKDTVKTLSDISEKVDETVLEKTPVDIQADFEASQSRFDESIKGMEQDIKDIKQRLDTAKPQSQEKKQAKIDLSKANSELRSAEKEFNKKITGQAQGMRTFLGKEVKKAGVKLSAEQQDNLIDDIIIKTTSPDSASFALPLKNIVSQEVRKIKKPAKDEINAEDILKNFEKEPVKKYKDVKISKRDMEKMKKLSKKKEEIKAGDDVTFEGEDFFVKFVSERNGKSRIMLEDNSGSLLPISGKDIEGVVKKEDIEVVKKIGKKEKKEFESVVFDGSKKTKDFLQKKVDEGKIKIEGMKSKTQKEKVADVVEKKEKTISYENNEPEKGVKIYGSITGDTATLSSIEISKSKRESGIGTKVINDFEKWAKENGAKRIEINAYKDSIGFWEKMGYTMEKEFPIIDGDKQDYKDGFKNLTLDKKTEIKDNVVNGINTKTKSELSNTGTVQSRDVEQGSGEVESTGTDRTTSAGKSGTRFKRDTGTSVRIGKKKRAEINSQAISLLESKNYSTNQADYSKEELVLLSNYSGAGGKETAGAEGKGLLSEYYTDPKIVEKLWDITLQYVAPTEIFEPSVGTGNILEQAPEEANIAGTEYEKVSGTIAQILLPDADISIGNGEVRGNAGDFQTIFFDEKTGKKKTISKKYNLVIGNPPFGKRAGFLKGRGEEENINRWEEYFIKRGLDMVEEGGVVSYIVNSSFLQKGLSKGKGKISTVGKLIDAYRLPEGAFADTTTGTDIVVFKKPTKEELASDSITGGLPDMINDSFFTKNPDKILGEVKTRKNRFGQEETFVEGTIENLSDLPTFDKKADVEKPFVQPQIQKNTSPVVEKVKNKISKNKKASKITQIYTPEFTKKLLGKNPEISGSQDISRTGLDLKGEERKVYENVERDGSTPYSESYAKYLNYENGKYYNDVNYFSGNISKKLSHLEKDKKEITVEQYDKQKQGLSDILPEKKTIETITWHPLDRHLGKKKFTAGTMRGEVETNVIDNFTAWVHRKRPTLSGGVYPSDVTAYVNGRRARAKTNSLTPSIESDAKRLFEHFIKNELPKEVRDELVADYNKTKNSYVAPNYDKMPVYLEDMAKEFRGETFEATGVQKSGVGFLANKGTGLIAYGVGVGKTHTMLLATVANMQKGNSKRPLFIVPKSTIEKTWINTILSMFPKLTVVNLGGLTISEIKRLKKERGEDPAGWVKDGEIAVISHEGVLKLGLTEEQMREAGASLQDAMFETGATKRKKENQKEDIEEIVGRLQGDPELSFDKLGIDHLSVDEIHNFRKVFKGAKKEEEGGGKARFANVIGGIPSKRAQKLFILSQLIQKNNNGRNVFLASATPFENHATEVYNILSFIAGDQLREMGIFNINDFFSTYADFTTEATLGLNNEVKQKQVMYNYANVSSLQMLMRQFIDYKVDPTLIRPDKKVLTPHLGMSEMQKDNSRKIQALLAGFELDTDTGEMKELPDGDKDGAFLKASTYSISNAVSPYFIGEWSKPFTPEELVKNSPKLELSFEVIKKNRETKNTKDYGTFVYMGKHGVKNGGQEAFAEYIRGNAGYKKEEVRVLNGTIKNAERELIKEGFNNGTIKVLIGGDNTKEGIDLQNNAVTTINVALGWNPTETNQVEGRGWRQGNKRNIYTIIYPLVENSGDVQMYAKFAEKGGRINDLFSYYGDIFNTGEVDPREKKLALVTDPEAKAELAMGIKAEERRIQTIAQETELSQMEEDREKLKDYKEEIENYKGYLKNKEDRWGNPLSKDAIKEYKSDLRSTEMKLKTVEARIERAGVKDLDKYIEDLDAKIISGKLSEEDSKKEKADLVKQFKKEYIEFVKNRKTISDHISEYGDIIGEVYERTQEEMADLKRAKQEALERGEIKYKLKDDLTVSTKTKDGVSRKEAYAQKMATDFLTDFKQRLNLNFQVVWADKILSDMKIMNPLTKKVLGFKDAYGFFADNTIALIREAGFYTAKHEVVHLTLANADKIDILKRNGITRDKILRQQADQMGIKDVTVSNSGLIEEKVAEAFEDYKNGKLKPKGLIDKFFRILERMIENLIRTIKRTKGDLIKNYFDILTEGRETGNRIVELENRGIVQSFLKDGVINIEKMDYAIGLIEDAKSKMRGKKIKPMEKEMADSLMKEFLLAKTVSDKLAVFDKLSLEELVAFRETEAHSQMVRYVAGSNIKYKLRGEDKLFSKLKKQYNELVTKKDQLEADTEQWKKDLDESTLVKEMRESLAEEKNKDIKGLVKYTNKKTGELPEVTGKGASEFATRGDDIITEYGFETSEEAREEMKAYLVRKQEIISTRNKLRELRRDISTAKKEGLTTGKALRDIQRRLKLRKQMLEKKDYYVDMGIKRGQESALKSVSQRRRAIASTQDAFDISDSIKDRIIGKTLKGQRIHLMKEDTFNDFLIRFTNLAQLERARLSAQDTVKAVEQAGDFQKIDNLRLALGLPVVSQMTEIEANLFVDELSKYEFGDVFLTKRQIETLYRTDFEKIATERELYIKIKEKTDLTKEDLKQDTMPFLAYFANGLRKSRHSKLFRLFVNDTIKAEAEATTGIVGYQRIIDKLARKSRRSNLRGKSIKEKFWDIIAPTEEIVRGYIEANSETKAEYAKENNMTLENIEFGNTIIKFNRMMYDYYVKNYDLHSRFGEGKEKDYFPNLRRGFLETAKDETFVNGFLNIIKDQQEAETSAMILTGRTGEIVPFEKWNKHMQFRGGEITPTNNVARATMSSATMFFRKKAIDKFVPKLNTLLSIRQDILPKTDEGLQKNPQVEQYLKKVINEARGRNIGGGESLIPAQAGKTDTILRGLISLVTVHKLGGRVNVGSSSFVGEMMALLTSTILEPKKVLRGLTRQANLKKTSRVVKENVALIGRTPFEDLLSPETGAFGKIYDGLMVLFAIGSYQAKKIGLLSHMSEEQWAKEILTATEQMEISLKQNKYKKGELHAGSLVGKTSIGKIFGQFKTWAFDIVTTGLSSTTRLTQHYNPKSNKNYSKEEITEYKQDVVALILTATVGYILQVMMLAFFVDDDDEEDRTTLWYVVRELGTHLQAVSTLLGVNTYKKEFDPMSAPLVGVSKDIGKLIYYIITQEEYKEDTYGYGIGDKKLWKEFNRVFTPVAVSQYKGKSEKVDTEKDMTRNSTATPEEIVNKVYATELNKKTGDKLIEYKNKKIGEIVLERYFIENHGDSVIGNIVLEEKRTDTTNEEIIKLLVDYAKEVGIDQAYSELKELKKDRQLCSNTKRKTGCLISDQLFKDFQRAKKLF